MAKARKKDLKAETLLSVLGRDAAAHSGVVNVPVYHASTILYPDVAALKKAGKREFGKVFYGRHGTPTTFALQDTVARIEGGWRSFAFSSGKAAILAALFAFLDSGDHLLMVDSAYGPSRELAKGLLNRMGVSHTFYDPLVGAGIAKLIQPNTRVVFTEAPGSITFEMQDLPAIAKSAHAAGACVIMDNTWASPLLCNPFALGADVSVQAGTKYIVGHSDAMLGMVTVNEKSRRSRISAPLPARMIVISRFAACARSPCASNARAKPAYASPNGWPSARRSHASCIPLCRAIRATRSGAAISRAHRACSVSC